MFYSLIYKVFVEMPKIWKKKNTVSRCAYVIFFWECLLESMTRFCFIDKSAWVFFLLLLLLRCCYIDSKMSMVQIAKANSLFLINIYALCCRWNNFSFHQFFSLLCVFKLILINSLSSFLFCFFFSIVCFFLCVFSRFFFVLLKWAVFMEFSS